MAWVKGGVQISENIFMQLKDEMICHLKTFVLFINLGHRIRLPFFVYSIQLK